MVGDQTASGHLLNIDVRLKEQEPASVSVSANSSVDILIYMFKVNLLSQKDHTHRIKSVVL